MSESSGFVQTPIPELNSRRQLELSEITNIAEALGATHILRGGAGISVYAKDKGYYYDETLSGDVLVADLKRNIKRGGRHTAQAVRLLQDAISLNRNRGSEHPLAKGVEIGVNTRELLKKIPKKRVAKANGESTQNNSITPPPDKDFNPF